LDDWYKYSVTNKTFEEITSYPGGDRAMGSSAIKDNYIYAGLGWSTPTYYDDFYRFNISGDVWETLDSFPGSERMRAISVVVGNDIYMGLGFSESSEGDIYLNDIYKFDTISLTWSGGLTPCPIGLNGAVAAVIGTKIYVGTGTESAGGSSYCIATKRWYEYETTTDTWTAKIDFPDYARAEASVGICDGKVYVGNGFNNSTYYDDWWAYDPILNSWTQVTSFTGNKRRSSASVNVGDDIFILFGVNG